MEKEKIRISLQSFHPAYLNEACQIILSFFETMESIEKIKGPIPLPTKRRIYCVLRSPHVDKDSREQFEIRRYKKIIDVYSESSQIVDSLVQLKLPAGVFFNFQVYSKLSLEA
jgi:small subunit ribosomal protein S10